MKVALPVIIAPAQLVAWGTFYYALPVFVEPLSKDFGWSDQSIFFGLSLALLTSVLVAPAVGWEIDRRGGKLVLVVGHIIGAFCLLLLSHVQSLPAFFALCCGLGISQAACLYDAAFSVLHRRLGNHAPRAIIQTSLVGGFAGTVFVPATQYGIELLDWRTTCWLLAGSAIAPSLVYGLFLPSEPVVSASESHDPAQAATPWSGGLILMVAALALSAAGFTTITIHLVPLLLDRGLGGLTAAHIFALIGPSQIAGRLMIWLTPGRFTALKQGRLIFLMQPAAFVVLALAGTNQKYLILFAVLFGINSGLQTIVRGLAPAELCDGRVIGRVNGAIGAASGFARALAPALFAFISAQGGYDAAFAILIAASIAAAAAYGLVRSPKHPR